MSSYRNCVEDGPSDRRTDRQADRWSDRQTALKTAGKLWVRDRPRVCLDLRVKGQLGLRRSRQETGILAGLEQSAIGDKNTVKCES